MLYDYEIGPDWDNMINLESLSPPLPAPRGTFSKWKEDIEIGSGHTRGAGYATATWLWGYLTVAQRDILRTYCDDASADVCIKTRDRDDQYRDYTGIMHWPREEETFSDMVLDIEILFTHLIRKMLVGSVFFHVVGTFTASAVATYTAAADLSGSATIVAEGTVITP